MGLKSAFTFKGAITMNIILSLIIAVLVMYIGIENDPRINGRRKK